MATLSNIVRSVLTEYAVDGANFKSFLTADSQGLVFTIIDLAYDDSGRRFVATSVILEIEGGKDNGTVVILHDDNDKPVVDALVQAGIPREQIVLAYLGEALPETAQP